jgi:putative protein-disulfide isomerase
MSQEKTTLYYVYDPMCSWCWGYRPTWQKIEKSLPDNVEVEYVLGGLAPDSDIEMPAEMQKQIASYWHKIEDYLGTQFNHDFWKNNTPRRSTYPACRALIAARAQQAELALLEAIQHAYYLNAKNPSDDDVLIELATSCGLDVEEFKNAFYSADTHQALLKEIEFARSIGGNSFPSLFVLKGSAIHELPIDYHDAQTTLQQIEKLVS